MTPAVLIVDDEPSDREVLAAILHLPFAAGSGSLFEPRAPFHGAPYAFHFAADGAQGLQAAATLAGGGGPVVICCDVVMPEMCGLEFCVRLRRDPATRALPLLAVTGLDDDALWADLRAAGADGIVLKPFDPGEVRSRVHALAGRGR